jgi:hypothetical protein
MVTMKTALLSLATLAALTAVASAEPTDATGPAPRATQYLDLGVEAGALRTMVGGAHLQGGYRLGDTPLFAHAQLSAGQSGSDGDYQQMRVGAEARGCVWGERICAFGGLDVGYQHDHVVDQPSLLFSLAWEDDDTYVATAHDVIAVPRVGFELGGAVKLRTALELPMYQTIAGNTPMTHNGDVRSGLGAVLSMGVGYSF